MGIRFRVKGLCNLRRLRFSPKFQAELKRFRKGYLRNAAAIVGLTLLGTVPSLAFSSTQPIDFAAYFESRGAL